MDTLRGCIIAEQGYTLISLDANQIELRVLAFLSQDPQMLADLTTGDMHQATADKMGVDRYIAKQSNFGMVYGADEYKLSEMLECSVEEALAFQTAHKQAYPRLYQWMEEEIAKAKELGFVVNIFGRIRPLPDLFASSWKLRQKGEREVVNSLVQGAASDVVKQAGIYLRDMLDLRVRILLQIHDEWLLECPNDLLEESLSICKGLAGLLPQYPFSIKIGTVYNQLEGS